MFSFRTALLLGLISVFVFIPVSVHAQPNIVFQKEIHDLGDVTQGEQVEYIFTFENKGSEELVIQKVSSS